MSERVTGLGLLAAAMALAGCSESAPTGGDQAQAAGTTDASGWQHPRTAWGDPDLQGMWPIINLISTPFQRNEQYGDRDTLTDEEYAATQQRLAARDERYQEEIKSNKMGMGHWAEASHNNDAARLTSLLVEPKNGRFPELTERGKELASTLADAYLQVNTSTDPGAGIVGETMQFHGTADLYTLSGATPVATLLRDRDDRHHGTRR